MRAGLASWLARARADGLRPVVVNTAAYTAVDAAESDVERAFTVNAQGPAVLAEGCAEYGVHLVHLSTDYVFDGDAAAPYRPDDEPALRSVYGRSKLAGEQAVLAADAPTHVVRTAWLYGTYGNDFVRTMARLERTHETVDVVDDQCGSPTYELLRASSQSGDLAAERGELAATFPMRMNLSVSLDLAAHCRL